MSGKTKFSPDWMDAVLKDFSGKDAKGLQPFFVLSEMWLDGHKANEDDALKNRQQDHLSHFILRLAYCRTEELRRWFVTHESDLFRFKWWIFSQKSDTKELDKFLKTSGLNYDPISDGEKLEKKQKLMDAASYGFGTIKFEDEKYYKVHWLEAMDLVRARRVYVEAGLAYIPASELLSLVLGVFRSRLSHNLVLTCRALPVLEDDTRLVNMVQNLDKR